MKRKNAKTIEIDAKQGEEVVLTCNGASLVVKIGDGEIIPDFASSMVKAIELRPHAVMLATQRVYHKEHGSAHMLRSDVAHIRDAVFESVQPIQTEPTLPPTPND